MTRAIYRGTAVLALVLSVLIERLDALVAATTHVHGPRITPLFAVLVFLASLGYLVRSFQSELSGWYDVLRDGQWRR